MERKRLILVAALAVATLLAACAGGGPSGDPNPPIPPADTPTVLRPADGSTAVDSNSLAPNGSEMYTFTLGSDVNDLVIIELSAELQLLQRNRVGEVVAATDTSEYFGPGIGLTASGALGSQAVVTVPECRGSCIVLEAGPGEYFFEVRNQTGSTVTYDVYVYGAPSADTEEPNDTLPEAAVYEIDTIGEGAIETLFDTDWWLVQASEFSTGSVIFDAPGGIDIVAYVHPIAGAPHGPYTNGSRIELVAGDAIRVVSESGLAARGSNGVYYFSPTATVVPLDD